jgi:hypothetical protein
MDLSALHPEAKGLRLYRIAGDDLIACELVMFQNGRAAVDTVLRRAAISGRVEIEGEIKDHYADVYTREDCWEQTVALDARSYAALKNRWMRCRLDNPTTQEPPRHD